MLCQFIDIRFKTSGLSLWRFISIIVGEAWLVKYLHPKNERRHLTLWYDPAGNSFPKLRRATGFKVMNVLTIPLVLQVFMHFSNNCPSGGLCLLFKKNVRYIYKVILKIYLCKGLVKFLNYTELVSCLYFTISVWELEWNNELRTEVLSAGIY